MTIAEKPLLDNLRLETSLDLTPLQEKIGESRYVLLGEASHGTHEYYTWRTAISKRLIVEKGFSFIAVEGDWADCYRINRYVKGYENTSATAIDVLKKFKRWPSWMWANWEIAALMEWMREYNRNKSVDKKIGFYGLDLYGLWESMHAIVSYLRKEDPASAQLAIDAYRCFEPYQEGRDYASALLNLSANCTGEVVKLLKAIRKKSHHYDHDPEASLNAEMNANVIANAEQYYRSMVSFHDQSWNIRDAHMVEILEAIMNFHGRKAKCVVWEHNSHVGDARYMKMGNERMWNVGQLVRENHAVKDGVFVVGFASYEGSVIAGRMWGGTMEHIDMPKAGGNSIEYLLHDDAAENKLILLDNDYWKERFSDYKDHRAIGVVYEPRSDHGNYVPTLLALRYDALIYIDRSTALHPLYLQPDGTKIPETYPFGF